MSKSYKVQSNVTTAALGMGSRKAANTGGSLVRIPMHDTFVGGLADVDLIVTSVAARADTNALAIAAQPDIPRNLTITSDAAQTEHIVFVGTDQFDNAITETIHFNGAATVEGVKVFKTVVSATPEARSGVANISVGTGNLIGTSHRIVGLGMTSGVYTTASGETTMVQDTTCPVRAVTVDVHGVSFQHNLAAATTTELRYLTDEMR